MTDAELLRQYADHGNNAAFAEVVERHLPLVYAAALRQVSGDEGLAHDVAQAVFTALARHAAGLSRHEALVGWLHTTTRFAAAKTMRGERRRRRRETGAYTMQQFEHGDRPVENWEELRPVIDDALGSLHERDRTAVLLRYFEGKSFPEIAERLSLSADAARLRVERALEKMRPRLRRHGIDSTAAALGIALASQPVVALPAALAATVTSGALSTASAGAGGLVGWATLLTMGKTQTGVIAALLVASVTTFWVETRATQSLTADVARGRAALRPYHEAKAENERLRAELAREAPVAERAELARLQRLSKEMSAKYSALQRASRPGPRNAISHEEALAQRRRSPYAAYQGIVNAMLGESGEDVPALIALTEDARKEFADFFGRLPADIQARLGAPERLAGHAFLVWHWQGDPPRRYGGDVKQIPVDQGAEVAVSVTYWSGKTVTERMRFARGGDGWRFGPITREDALQMLALLDPATGELTNRPDTAFFQRKNTAQTTYRREK